MYPVRYLVIALVATIGAGAILSPRAEAAPLVPGAAPTPPDVFTNIPPGPVVASIVDMQIDPSIPIGTYTTEVIPDAARGNMLDFIIQFTLQGTIPIRSVTNGVFSSYSVDAGYTPPGQTGGGLMSGEYFPPTVNEDINKVVSFNFGSVVGTESSAILVIETNATAFMPGIINFNGVEPPGFQPVPMPIPGTLPLFATGLVGLGLLGWRRKRKAQAV